jgi:hypothetical protein
VRILCAWFYGLGLLGCSEASPGCLEFAVGNTYRIEYADVSDACVARQTHLRTSWTSMDTSWLTITGWVTERFDSKQEGCSLQFSSERFDTLDQEVVVIKGDHLVGDESGFRGAVSLEWALVDVDAYRKDSATATRKPFCTATARASLIRDPALGGATRGMIGSATEAALAGHGD